MSGLAKLKKVAFSKCKYEFDILNSYKQKRQKKRSVSEYANDAEKTIEKFALSLSLSFGIDWIHFGIRLGGKIGPIFGIAHLNLFSASVGWGKI